VKLLYKPIGLLLGFGAAILANAIVRKIWATVSDEEVPKPRERDRGWGEIAASAALQGAVMAGTRALVDRAGAKGFAKATGEWPD
jgi:hypothetical protein